MATDLRAHRGQAMIELALGMLALTLVVSMLTVFAIWMAKSLKMQNSVRTGPSKQSDTVEVTDFERENLFGVKQLEIKEEVKMP